MNKNPFIFVHSRTLQMDLPRTYTYDATIMQAKLNIRLINSLEPRDKPYEVVDCELKGFLLRVQPSGVMTYYFAYRNKQGRKNRYRIGNHHHFTPAQAREKAKEFWVK